MTKCKDRGVWSLSASVTFRPALAAILDAHAVDDPDTVDIMSINQSGAIVLTVADHLDWADSRSHQYTPPAKMDPYLAFIEYGESSNITPTLRRDGL